MSQGDQSEISRLEELRAFLILTAVIAPIVAVLAVSGYGFLVWMYQIVVGPPTGA